MQKIKKETKIPAVPQSRDKYSQVIFYSIFLRIHTHVHWDYNLWILL